MPTLGLKASGLVTLCLGLVLLGSAPAWGTNNQCLSQWELQPQAEAKTHWSPYPTWEDGTGKEIKFTRTLLMGMFPMDGTVSMFWNSTGLSLFPTVFRTIELSKGGRVFHKIAVRWPLEANAGEWETWYVKVLTKAMESTPNAWLKALTEIRINMSPHLMAGLMLQRNPPGSAEAGSSIDLYPAFYEGSDGFSARMNRRDTLHHEMGHIILDAVKRKPKFRDIIERYIEAMKKDGTSVSDYGDQNVHEDFAEAAREYSYTLGENPKVRARFKHRFQIIDEITRELESW